MRSMLKTASGWQALLIIVLAISIGGCQASCDKEPSMSSKPAASVNGVDLSSAELDILHQRAAERLTADGRQIDKRLDRELRSSILRKMIDDEIIRQRAVKEGVDIDRFERVAGLEHYKERVGGPKGYELFLQQQKLSEEQVLSSILATMRREKLIEKLEEIAEPSEEEIEANYKANENLYTRPEMVRAQHILLQAGVDEPADKIELVKKKAERLLKELGDGASFEKLVQKYSECPSREQGGDLGFFAKGRMVKAFEEAAFNAPIKKPIGPVRTDFGFHIIYVTKKQAASNSPLAQVRDQVIEFIKRDKQSRKSQELLQAMRKQAKIAIHDPSLSKEEYEMQASY